MIIIGTDSKVHKHYVRYCTCVLDTETGLLEKHYEMSKSISRSARLHNEAALTLSHAALYDPKEVEMHFDFSPNPMHKSFPIYQTYKSLGKFKPEAFMATAVADYFLEH